MIEEKSLTDLLKIDEIREGKTYDPTNIGNYYSTRKEALISGLITTAALLGAAGYGLYLFRELFSN